MRTRVKICGITRCEDAQLAVDAGADAIGLVFYEKSPRFVSNTQAAEISQMIPAFVNRVALFKDAEKQARKDKLHIWGDPDLTKKYLRLKSKWGMGYL